MQSIPADLLGPEMKTALASGQSRMRQPVRTRHARHERLNLLGSSWLMEVERCAASTFAF